MPKKSDPDPPLRLPVKLEPTSNGEFFPRPPTRAIAHAQRSALDTAVEAARKLGVSRRDFLRSSCGAATVLLALNHLPGCGGGGSYRVPPEAAHDEDAADEALGGDELIFDVQTHHVEAERPWWQADRPTLGDFLQRSPASDCDADHWAECFSRDAFVREVFMDSDTHLGVLSALWGDEAINPIHADEMAKTRDRIAELGRRLRIHGVVLPKAHSAEETDEHMTALAETWKVAAWKLYPVWGPDGTGYRLDDDETGGRAIRKGLELGVPIVAVHKGLPLAGMDPTYTRPDDVGPAAKQHPDASFLIYHSGFEVDHVEGSYDPDADRGVDALITSCKEHGIGKDGNVYAELGSLWREVMRDPDQAAHVLGKLLAHFGEDRILWGTDAIWFGSPQDQIQAFRTFEISEQLQERHGYPPLTPEAKAKIFGLNAARVYGVDAAEMKAATSGDELARAKQRYRHDPQPSHRTYGPRSRREMLAFLRYKGGMPG
ncbi:MAG: amidohydrolase family protein [Polyangiales bacterium]